MKVFLAIPLVLVVLQATKAYPKNGQLEADADAEIRSGECADAAYYFDAIQKEFAKILPSVKGNKDQANALEYSLSCLTGCEGDFMCSMDCGLEADTAQLRSDACADTAYYFDAIQKKFAKILPSVKENKDQANSLDYSLSCLAGCEGDFMCSMDCGLETDAAQQSSDTCADAAYYFDAIQKKYAKILPSVKGNKDQANALDYSLSCLTGCEGDAMCSMDCGLEADAALLRSDACADTAYYFDAIQKKFAKILPSVKGNKDQANSLDYSLSCLAGCEGDAMCSMDCGLD